MLEWLKTILGDNYSEEIDKKVSDEIGKGFVARADFNAINEEKKTLNAQLGERDSQLDELKKIDAAGLQAKIVELQAANDTAKSEHEKQLSSIKRDSALDAALVSAKARDVKAARALLDMDAIKLDGDKILGLDGQLDTLKKDKAFLFDIEPESKPGPKFKSGLEHGGSLEPGDKFISAALKAAGLSEKGE